MKKQLSMRIAAALLVVLLMTTGLTSGTFAKYASSANAADAARVAKWSFDVGTGNNFVATKTFAFDLFETVYDTVLQNGASVADEDVKNSTIAPGTQGSFDLVITNTSEVDSRLKLQFDWNELSDYITFQHTVVDTEGTEMIANEGFYAVPIGKTITCTVSWLWPYHQSNHQDLADTTVGKKSIDDRQFTVSATVTAEQVD